MWYPQRDSNPRRIREREIIPQNVAINDSLKWVMTLVGKAFPGIKRVGICPKYVLVFQEVSYV